MINKVQIRRNLVEVAYKFGFGKGGFRNAEQLAKRTAEAIAQGKPLSIGRLGINEINGAIMFSEDSHPWWVTYEPENIPRNLNVNVGLYPWDDDFYRQWSKAYLEVNRKCDFFAVYLNVNELYYFRRYLKSGFEMSRSWLIHPMLQGMNWMTACEGKRILVVSPNIGTVEKQLSQKKEIWSKTEFDLPDAEYLYIKPPFSPTIDPGNKTESWFDELERMQAEMDAMDFDVALIAAGGYANFLTAHAKKKGKVGLNMGGALDPLFGIKTKRYIGGNNAMPESLMNEHWVTPSDKDKPEGASRIEGGCYW